MSKYLVQAKKLELQTEGHAYELRRRDLEPLRNSITLSGGHQITITHWCRWAPVVELTEYGLEGFTAEEEQAFVAITERGLSVGNYQELNEYILALEQKLRESES